MKVIDLLTKFDSLSNQTEEQRESLVTLAKVYGLNGSVPAAIARIVLGTPVRPITVRTAPLRHKSRFGAGVSANDEDAIARRQALGLASGFICEVCKGWANEKYLVPVFVGEQNDQHLVCKWCSEGGVGFNPDHTGLAYLESVLGKDKYATK